MPGFELIGKKEKEEINKIFNESNGVLFAHGFEKLRRNIYRVRKFEKLVSKFLNVKYCLATTSGTMAQYIAMKAMGIGPGDEVITQSFTFVATVESIVEARAIPVCTEIDDTLNMCPIDLEKKINKNTIGVVITHLCGHPCEMDQIIDICRKYNLFLIEDNCIFINLLDLKKLEIPRVTVQIF